MEKQQYTFEDFIMNAGFEHEYFLRGMDELLVDHEYKPKVELKKSGYAISYVNSKAKKTLLNCGSRKKGIFIRIYGDHASEYVHIFDSLPDSMKNEIIMGQDCKRMVDENACNSRCMKGISIVMNDQLYEKCRYSALMFYVEQEKYNSIKDMITNEIS